MAKHDDVAAIRIKNRYAGLYIARLQTGGSVTLPEAPFLHLFIVRGAVDLEGAGPLGTGDAIRFTATAGQRFTATEPKRSSSRRCMHRWGTGDDCSAQGIWPSIH